MSSGYGGQVSAVGIDRPDNFLGSVEKKINIACQRLGEVRIRLSGVADRIWGASPEGKQGVSGISSSGPASSRIDCALAELNNCITAVDEALVRVQEIA